VRRAFTRVVGEGDRSAGLGGFVDGGERPHVRQRVCPVRMERLLRQQLVAEVREFLFDLVNLVEVDVDAGSVADDREPSVLPLVERRIEDQSGVRSGDFEPARVLGVLAHRTQRVDATGELQPVRGVFVDIGERLVVRAGPSRHAHGVGAEHEPNRVERVHAQIHERTAAGQLRVEAPLVVVAPELTEHRL